MNLVLNFTKHKRSAFKSSYWHTKNIFRIRGFLLQQDIQKSFCRLLFLVGQMEVISVNKSFRQLYCIQNAADRVLTKCRKINHITQVIQSLHSVQYPGSLLYGKNVSRKNMTSWTEYEDIQPLLFSIRQFTCPSITILLHFVWLSHLIL